LIESGKRHEARAPDQQILAWNPASFGTLTRLADSYEAQGNAAEAARALSQARESDPSDPYLLVAHARALFASGNRWEARRLLTSWMASNKAPVLPVFLYHGLTPFLRDPMLAYPVHMTTARFEDQMTALKEAQFTPVTAEEVDQWIHGKHTLPPRPVLITFDDNRMDSFRQADPVLKRTGMKATMFAIVHYADRNYPNYASWKELAAYARTGRWEIQSHGDSAHLPIVVDRAGHEAMFLTNKKWLEKYGRMETNAEWRRRLELDHRSAKQWITQFIGRTPVAFAWPEGNYGQMGISNTPKAAETNLAIARAAYSTTYHQDTYGLNTRTRDPLLLTRYEPRPAESGADLVRHVRDKSPFSIMRIDLLRWAAWVGRTREAYHWLDELRKNGASDKNLWLQEAQIRTSVGDWEGARKLAENARTFDPPRDPIGEPSESERLLHFLDIRQRPEWSPGFSYFADSRDRQNWSFFQTLTLQGKNHVEWTGLQSHLSLHDVNDIHVNDEHLGLGVRKMFGLYHIVSADVQGHLINEGAPDTVSVQAGARSQWTDDVATQFEAGRVPMETGQALHEGIRTGFLGGGLGWTLNLWKLEPWMRGAAMTDGNARISGRAKVSRGLYALGRRPARGVSDESGDHPPR
jgi:peptidoglycan/xylan/chitin deacetylase (PgdA/CDA1 family)